MILSHSFGGTTPCNQVMKRVVISSENNVGYLTRMYMIDDLPQGPQGPQGAQGPQGENDTSEIKVFSGDMVNPGDFAEHTLFTQNSHRSTVVTLTVIAHDMNSNTAYLYHHSSSYWSRSWTNEPSRQDLITPVNNISGDPDHFIFTHFNDGNDIKVRLTHNVNISTDVKYKIIAKMLTA